jgi:hypothetical protein
MQINKHEKCVGRRCAGEQENRYTKKHAAAKGSDCQSQTEAFLTEIPEIPSIQKDELDSLLNRSLKSGLVKSGLSLPHPPFKTMQEKLSVAGSAIPDQGSGKILASVYHSKSEVLEELLASIEHQVIYIGSAHAPPSTGVGIVFQVLRLSPYEPDKRQGKGEGTFKILVLSVDLSGPSDQGVLHKGDVLVGIDGRNVNGKSWEQVSPQIQGHLGSFVNLSFERQGIQKSKPSEGDNQNFGQTLQHEVSARATMDKQLQYSLRVLRGDHRIVRTSAVWPDPDTYTRTSIFIFSRQLKVLRLAIYICCETAST